MEIENKNKRRVFNWYSTLRKKCPYSELFWSVFSGIRTEYGEIQSISPYSVRMLENADHNNSEYGRFLRSVTLLPNTIFMVSFFENRPRKKTEMILRSFKSLAFALFEYTLKTWQYSYRKFFKVYLSIAHHYA